MTDTANRGDRGRAEVWDRFDRLVRAAVMRGRGPGDSDPEPPAASYDLVVPLADVSELVEWIVGPRLHHP